ncbi:unnamed protein product [Moneuplotes crassus]|uniref:Uncharacterized protein n=1 Tax=Euplotes crassus TaxID=5936 RepID=A0AAD1XHM4_EUPCR|nr:unnamed protein product [Moneuplotes crassus]
MKKNQNLDNQTYNPYYRQEDDQVQPSYPQVPTAQNPNDGHSQNVPSGYPVNNYGGGYPQDSYGGYPQQNYGGHPQQNYGVHPQNNAGGYPQNQGAYPLVAPQDVMHKHGSKNKSKREESGFHSDEGDSEGALDCFSKMKGDSGRQGFVQKVFGIMGVQVLFTALFTYWVISDYGRMQFCIDNMWLYFVCVAGTVAIMCALMCIQKAARNFPVNYILLGIFTLLESYVVATIASMYEPQSVFLAACYAVGLFTILTIYACSTKGDIGCMGPLIWVSMGLGLLTFILYFLFPSHIMHLIFCWVGLICTCIYVIYDVYLITEKHGLSYDDYIIGALLIYTDLISLFIYILSIIGDKR